jgi:hypothetical protein
MRRILKFFFFLAAMAVILMTLNFIYLYAQNKEANSMLFRLIKTLLDKINNL